MSYVMVHLALRRRLLVAAACIVAARYLAQPPANDIAAAMFVLIAIAAILSALRVAWLKWSVSLWP
jgi:hypothetical protein